MPTYTGSSVTFDDVEMVWEGQGRKSVLVKINGDKHFIPKSQIDWVNTNCQYKGQVGRMVMSEWIWGQKRDEAPVEDNPDWKEKQAKKDQDGSPGDGLPF